MKGWGVDVDARDIHEIASHKKVCVGVGVGVGVGVAHRLTGTHRHAHTHTHAYAHTRTYRDTPSTRLFCFSLTHTRINTQSHTPHATAHTIATNYCHKLLPQTIATNYCHTLLPHTIATHYCHTLLPHTIATHYCHTDLVQDVQGGEDTQDVSSCRSPSAKEPLIMGLF